MRQMVVSTCARFDSSNAEPIPGTEGAGSPFFSPNGEWLGFARGDVIMKKLISGGPPVKVADAVW
jgi:hypothetical protein